MIDLLGTMPNRAEGKGKKKKETSKGYGDQKPKKPGALYPHSDTLKTLSKTQHARYIHA